jgi:hypothetical protein
VKLQHQNLEQGFFQSQTGVRRHTWYAIVLSLDRGKFAALYR